MSKNKKTIAYLAALLYSIIIGFSFLFTKLALDVSDPINVLAYRFIASFIAISIPVALKLLPVNLNIKRIIKVLPLAIIYPLCFFALQTFGLQYSSSSEAGIFLATAPVFTAIMASYFLGEKSNLYQKISIILSLGGVTYISLKKGANIDLANIKGILFLLLSAFLFSTYSIFTRKLSEDYTATELSLVMITVSFISFSSFALIRQLAYGNLLDFFMPLTNLKFIVSILYLGVLSTLGTSLLTNFALSRLEASKMIVFSNLGTVISILAGLIFLKEEVLYYHIIGSIMIIIGVLGTNFLGNK